MCGICGIIDFSQQFSPEQRKTHVEKMNQALFHRGPDEGGHYTDEFVSMGMRRLSIIDLAGGQQPIFNETNDICVFFNGEIYNYQTLRQDLIAKGHQFKTNTDTETLVHLYETYGEQMLTKLKGMFTFCIYDLKAKTCLLARDRFGEKPLFYYHKNNTFSFASELQSLVCQAQIPRKLNEEALPYYFRTSLVPEPLTLFKDIFSLPPGHFLRITPHNVDIQPYFKLCYPKNTVIKTEEEAVALIQPLLEQAVQRQTVSDVPIGAFLSGGIDSSTIVALLQKNASKQIKTFNVRFEDEAYDESPIARKVAAYWETDHHEIVIPNYDFDEGIFWDIIKHVGVPFRDSSAIPTYLITKAIRKHVKVALSGDGGDELFGGYSMFQWHDKILKLKSIPAPIRAIGQSGINLAQQIPPLKSFSKLRQVQRALSTAKLTKVDIPIALNGFFSDEEINRLMGKNEGYPLLKAYPEIAHSWSALRKIMYYRTAHTLPANMLIKVDRMSMANSLEVRAPFLDPDLFDAAAQLPDDLLIKAGKGKYLIRKIMEKALPPEVFNHPKKGFDIPLFKYQNEVFKKLAHRLVFEDNPFKTLFDEAFLKEIYYQGLNHKQNTAKLSVFQSAHRLWMLMMLSGWGKYFGVTR